MPTATVTFRKLVVNVQNYESEDVDDDCLVSRLHFSLTVRDVTYDDMSVEVTQPRGTRYEDDELDVGTPLGSYQGRWNYDDFAKLVQPIYRQALGSQASVLRIEGVQGMVISNLTLNLPPIARPLELPN